MSKYEYGYDENFENYQIIIQFPEVFALIIL